MSKKIVYYVQRYRPTHEAISKEVDILSTYFGQTNKVKIHDLHLGGLFNFNFNNTLNSYHFIYYPLLFLRTWFVSKKSHINHIYTSLGDLPYLKVLDLKNTILTAAASCGFDKVKKRFRYLKKLKKVIVESEIQKKQLLRLGMDEHKLELIYPPADLEKFNYISPPDKFTILCASCPVRESDFKKRGINLIFDTFKDLENVDITLLWRKGAYDAVCRLKDYLAVENISIPNSFVKDMNSEYGKVHCTIIPYTKYDYYLKLTPNSAVESLACGKPLLVSTNCGIAKFVKENKCGVVFMPTSEGLKGAIEKIRKNYKKYQMNCRSVAEKYFSQKDFIEKYTEIYDEI